MWSVGLIHEGMVKIETNGVFYNSKMRFCRDADMVVFRNLDSRIYLDALAATGIRGIRATIEAGFTVEFNDIDPRAVEVIKKNLELNGIKAVVHNEDAAILMRRKKYDHVDLDPFGSPVEFLESACYSARRYISVTATDTAALCGSATTSGLRKYSTYAVKTEYYHETGLRVLIGRIVSTLTKYDKFAEVLVSWAKEHYYRVHLKIGRSSKKAGEIYEKIGYIFHCRKCGNRFAKSVFEAEPCECDCGSRFIRLGPLWIGELHNADFVKKLDKKGETGKLFETIEGELETITYYELHNLTRMLRVSPPPIQRILEKLIDEGYRASRTRFSGTSFKTDANIDEIKRIILSL
uniref:tRNA (guanine(26)-N(2))-dimethyltransferase n=1 Tax=Geoglobus ahangari TaxID=113653 RepID=A0A7C4WBC5_9EURY